jgi:hypothetical protein
MKRYVWSAAAGAFFTMTLALPASAGIQNGFGGISWATSLRRVADCETVGVKGDIRYCARPNQPHTLMGKPIARVTYGFYKEAFFAVFIRSDEVNKKNVNEKIALWPVILPAAAVKCTAPLPKLLEENAPWDFSTWIKSSDRDPSP